jgi:ACS family hexuronate transporter-like MFS transporter
VQSQETTAVPPATPDSPPLGPVGRYRWLICALLFFATTVNYVDRQVIGILKPVLKDELGWNEIDYSNVVFAFQTAYAVGYLVAGRLIDRVGVRLGYAVAVALWSLAAMGHAWARGVAGFCAARFALGLAEGGNFPAAVKSVGEWFPRTERALATGVFNAGSNVGALVTPLIVPWITLHYGWPAAFLVTGSFGFLWLVVWLATYDRPERHPRVTPAELAHIRSDPPEPAVAIPWLDLLRYRPTWAFAVGMFLTSPVWWFYLFWVPGFLNERFGVDLQHLGPPLVVIYLMTDVGSVAGGWLSSWLIGRGWGVNAGRKTAMLACALCVIPVFAAGIVADQWTAVVLIGLAASAHQGWSANLYTLVSDTMPPATVSSVVGIGGMAGAVGGMGVAKLAGYVLEWTGQYLVLFALAPAAYLVAFAVIQMLVPRLEPER